MKTEELSLLLFQEQRQEQRQSDRSRDKGRVQLQNSGNRTLQPAEQRQRQRQRAVTNSENRPTWRTDIKFRESPKPADTVICIIPRIITRWALHITYKPYSGNRLTLWQSIHICLLYYGAHKMKFQMVGPLPNRNRRSQGQWNIATESCDCD